VCVCLHLSSFDTASKSRRSSKKSTSESSASSTSCFSSSLVRLSHLLLACFQKGSEVKYRGEFCLPFQPVLVQKEQEK